MNSVAVAARDFLDRWIHPDAADEPKRAAEHRSLIAALLALSFFGVCAFPVWTAVVGQFGIAEVSLFALLTAPLLIAGYLARSGDIEHAELLFATLLSILAIALSLSGVPAPALTLLALVAIEGVIAESRRVLVACLTLAAAGLAAVWLIPEIEGLAAGNMQPLAICTAGLLAASTALRIRGSRKHIAAAAEDSEQNYKVFADALGGLVTRHTANGDAVFASPASRSFLGTSPAELMGGRFVQRIQLSDRVAFLNAIRECTQSAKEGTIRLRMLRAQRAQAGRTKLETATMEMTYRPMVDDHTGEVTAIAVTRDLAEEAAPANAPTQIAALRDPLIAIVEFSAMLGRRLPVAANANAPDYARLIQSSASQMLDMVNAASIGEMAGKPVHGRPNGQFLPAATKSNHQVPAARNSGQNGQKKVFFPDLARLSGASRPTRERTGG